MGWLLQYARTVPAMRILEKFSESKSAERRNEDAMVITGDYVAVIDGVSDKTGLTYLMPDGAEVSSGVFAAQTIAASITTLAPDVTMTEAISTLSNDLRTAVTAQRPDLGCGDLPAACVVIYSRKLHQVWSVGDCAWKWRDTLHQPVLDLDRVTIAARVARVRMALAAGSTVEELRHNDPGRDAIVPLLRHQATLANTTGPLSFGVINGDEVPAEHQHATPLSGSGILILTSDGYPVIHDSHIDTEAALKDLLARDPLCIDGLAGTKALDATARSFDDRTWVRLHVEDPDRPASCSTILSEVCASARTTAEKGLEMVRGRVRTFVLERL